MLLISEELVLFSGILWLLCKMENMGCKYLSIPICSVLVELNCTKQTNYQNQMGPTKHRKELQGTTRNYKILLRQRLRLRDRNICLFDYFIIPSRFPDCTRA